MNFHEFTFVIDHRLSDDEIDELFDRLDDVTPEREKVRTLLGFDRAGESLAAGCRRCMTSKRPVLWWARCSAKTW